MALSKSDVQENYFTTEELCEMFGVTRRSVYRWKKAGLLSYGLKAGQSCLYTPEEVQALKSALKNRSKSDNRQ